MLVIATGLSPTLATAGPCDPPPVQRPSRTDLKEVKRLDAQAQTAFNRGKYAKARELMLRAYTRSGEGVAFYNIARSFEMEGDLANAVACFETYLKVSKTLPDRREVKAHLEELREAQRGGDTSFTPAPPPPPRRTPRRR